MNRYVLRIGGTKMIYLYELKSYTVNAEGKMTNKVFMLVHARSVEEALTYWHEAQPSTSPISIENRGQAPVDEPCGVSVYFAGK